MLTRAEPRFFAGLPVMLGLVVFTEFALLRTATRTLVHIPGLGRIETPISLLAEVGRYSYYLAVVLLVVTLSTLGYQRLFRGGPSELITGVGTILFLVVAGAGRAGAVTQSAVGWSSIAILVVVTAATWRGVPTTPIGLFVLGSVAAGLTVVAQGSGGGLSGGQVDVLVLVAEISLILGGLTAPLLLRVVPRRPAITAGLVAAGLGIVGITRASSTLSILVLWNLGVPGWLPGVSYALALGVLVTTLWAAVTSKQHLAAIGLILLVAGGVGTTSTYQTGLVIAGILLIDLSLRALSRPDVASAMSDVHHETSLPLRASAFLRRPTPKWRRRSTPGSDTRMFSRSV